MAVRATKILPSEAIPTLDLTNQLDTSKAKLLPSSFQVIDLECNNRTSGKPFVAATAAEDFELLTGRGLKDRLFIALKPEFETQKISKEANASIEVIGRYSDPGKARHLHSRPLCSQQPDDSRSSNVLNG